MEHGAQIDAVDTSGDSALLGAVEAGNVETAKLLLELGANVNFVANDGELTQER